MEYIKLISEYTKDGMSHKSLFIFFFLITVVNASTKIQTMFRIRCFVELPIPMFLILNN